MGLFNGKPKAEQPVPQNAPPANVPAKPKIRVNLPPEPGDVVIAINDELRVCIPRRRSLTIGSGPAADCKVGGFDLAPLHARFDNRIIPAGYDPAHPYCNMTFVADIGGASVGQDLFGPRSRTGVASPKNPRFVMPLELGEVAPLQVGTIVLMGQLHIRVLSVGEDGR